MTVSDLELLDITSLFSLLFYSLSSEICDFSSLNLSSFGLRLTLLYESNSSRRRRFYYFKRLIYCSVKSLVPEGDFERNVDFSPYLRGVYYADNRLLKATFLASFDYCSSKNYFKGDLVLDLSPEFDGCTTFSSFFFPFAVVVAPTILDWAKLIPIKSFYNIAFTCDW